MLVKLRDTAKDFDFEQASLRAGKCMEMLQLCCDPTPVLIDTYKYLVKYQVNISLSFFRKTDCIGFVGCLSIV